MICSVSLVVLIFQRISPNHKFKEERECVCVACVGVCDCACVLWLVVSWWYEPPLLLCIQWCVPMTVCMGWECMAVMSIIGPVLVLQWRHCNDSMHFSPSFMQHWQRLAPHGPEVPLERSGHAAICLTSLLDLQNTLLVILGGYPNKDCWICNIHAQKWMRVGFA